MGHFAYETNAAQNYVWHTHFVIAPLDAESTGTHGYYRVRNTGIVYTYCQGIITGQNL